MADYLTIGALLILTAVALYLVTVIASSSRGNRVKEARIPWSENNPMKVLILTAEVGGGHVAVGQAARAELEAEGHEVTMVDGLRPLSLLMNWVLVHGYIEQVRHSQWTLAFIFHATATKLGAGFMRTLVGVLYSRRMLPLIEAEQPDVILSTYPLVTSALGHLRKHHGLTVPVSAIVPDFGVHPLWVSPGADLHLVASGQSVRLAERLGGKASHIRMPVETRFRERETREEARAKLNWPSDEFVALIVGGALGIGDIEGTAQCAANSGVRTVIVTGRNAELKARLLTRFADNPRIRIIGWTDRMSDLMSASNCLIQNAGGMTCIEAIHLGLPIIMFRPIRGHGEYNTIVMEHVGTACQAHTARELEIMLKGLRNGETSLKPPHRDPAAPGIATVLESLAKQPRSISTSRTRHAKPVVAGLVMLGLLSLAAFTQPSLAVAARGLNLPIPGAYPAPGRVTIAVRTTSPDTARMMETLAISKPEIHLTIFADNYAAKGLFPARGIKFGVAENTDNAILAPFWQDRDEAHTTALTIRERTGVAPRYYLPEKRTSFASLVDAPMDTHVVMRENLTTQVLTPGLVVVNVSGLTPAAARQEVMKTLEQVHAANLRCVPIGQL